VVRVDLFKSDLNAMDDLSDRWIDFDFSRVDVVVGVAVLVVVFVGRGGKAGTSSPSLLLLAAVADFLLLTTRGIVFNSS
jgi:hypothetical protein